MRLLPPPNIQDLLIPVIACLPTAFISPRPPPALLPYLSPILRQRLSLLADPSASSTNTSSDSRWLHLLTWSPARAHQLNEIVSNLNLEPHPVSGELELFEEDLDGEQGRIKYRRVDGETLQAKCDVVQHGLSVVWVWCTNDTGGVGLENAGNGEAEDGWRVAEVLPCADEDVADTARRTGAGSAWFDTMEEAEDAALAREGPPAVAQEGEQEDPVLRNGASMQDDDDKDEDDDYDDDDYWASYDRTPGRTPAKRSPGVPTSIRDLAMSRRQNNTDEKDYFARYGNEVQPAMDAHDPDEAKDGAGYQYGLDEEQVQIQQQQDQGPSGVSSGLLPAYQDVNMHAATETEDQAHARIPSGTERKLIESPRASRPSSPRDQSPIARLEASAEASSAAEIGVKQHISTEMKSLYRLAMTTGIDRAEFERVIKTELEVLDMMDF